MQTRRETIPFGKITGISIYNPRGEMDADISSLAATIAARGLIHPLIVHPSHSALDDPGSFKVLDGGRRWRALLLSPPETVEVDIVEGDEPELRELALLPNVARRQLHPVDEYEHFAALEEAGMVVAAIARDFGITTRDVNQRLALGRLAPKIRDAWRAGKISADVAKAFAEGETHEAQTAVLDDLTDGEKDFDEYEIDPYDVKRRLQSDAIRPSAAEAVYLGEEAYRAAGGRVRDSLFEEEIIWLDGTLCKRMAREKMMREAEAIATQEGWGFIRFENDIAWNERVEEAKPDLIEAESTRVAEIDAKLSELFNTGDDPAAIDAESTQLEIEKETIVAKATLRAVAQAERANLGIVIDLADDGTRLVIRRGVKQRAPAAAGDAGDSDAASGRQGKSASSGNGADAGAGGVPSAPAPNPEEKPSKAARAVLDEAMTQGFAQAVRGRPDIALMIAVAYLGPTYSTLGVSSLAGGAEPYAEHKHELLKAIDGIGQDQALILCARAPQADLLAAFAECVSASLRTAPVGLSALAPFAEALALRGAALRGGFLSHLDYDAYFAAATKDAAIAAIAACDGEPASIEAKKKKKPDIAKQAATSAKDSSWLPDPLAWWTQIKPKDEVRVHAEDTRTTAQAMNDAIGADDDRKAYVASFLEKHCVRDGNATIKSSILRARYESVCERNGREPLSTNGFGDAIAAAGIEKQRRNKGVFYIGIRLREPADGPAQQPAFANAAE